MDVYIEEQGERVLAQANTQSGTDFVDGWIGPILEVIDSGRIVVPRESLPEFLRAGEQNDVRIGGGGVTLTFDPVAAKEVASVAIVEAHKAKREQLEAEVVEANELAEKYADLLAAGEDPTKHPYPTRERRSLGERYPTGILSGYEGLEVVYREWNEARGSANPARPFNNGEVWRLCERFAQSIGTPIAFTDLKGLHFRSTDPVAAVLIRFEDAGQLVVRRTKIDGKVAFLVRERRPDDPPQGAYGRGSLPEEAV